MPNSDQILVLQSSYYLQVYITNFLGHITLQFRKISMTKVVDVGFGFSMQSVIPLCEILETPG